MQSRRDRIAQTRRGLGAALAVSMFWAASVRAQTPACDQLKASLAARIEATGVRGYSLDAVRAGSPAPSDAKVIGTCESGAYKVLYRRWGGARPLAGAASAAGPASAAQGPVLPATLPRPAPPAVLPAPVPAKEAASALPARGREPEKPPVPGAGEEAAGRSVDRPVALPVPPAPARIDTAPTVQPAPAPQASGFLRENWLWIVASALLAVLALAWAWRTYFSAYDKAGLPRGPRL